MAYLNPATPSFSPAGDMQPFSEKAHAETERQIGLYRVASTALANQATNVARTKKMLIDIEMGVYLDPVVSALRIPLESFQILLADHFTAFSSLFLIASDQDYLSTFKTKGVEVLFKERANFLPTLSSITIPREKFVQILRDAPKPPLRAATFKEHIGFQQKVLHYLCDTLQADNAASSVSGDSLDPTQEIPISASVRPTIAPKLTQNISATL